MHNPSSSERLGIATIVLTVIMSTLVITLIVIAWLFATRKMREMQSKFFIGIDCNLLFKNVSHQHILSRGLFIVRLSVTIIIWYCVTMAERIVEIFHYIIVLIVYSLRRSECCNNSLKFK